MESLLGLTLVAGLEGKRAEAEVNAREALAILEEAGDRYMAGVLHLALGAAMTPARHAEAERWLSQAANLGRASGDRFTPCAADLWLAVCLSRAGRITEASLALSRALNTAQVHDYDFLFTHFPLLGPKDQASRSELISLMRMGGQDKMLPYASRLLREIDPFAGLSREVAFAIRAANAPLYIQALGPFRVWRDGREIHRAAWGREKALHLLQFLVCHRGRLIHREQILEALWPDNPPATAATGLRVALSALRKALVPTPASLPLPHSAGEGPGVGAFIRREGESLQLDLASGVRVDADEFARIAQSARTLETDDPGESINLYESALALYRGDFLEESPYAEWAGEERERLLAEYLSVAERLARLWANRGDYERGARWANAILARDPLWEEAYALLMECHWKQGNRALAVRTFDRCRKRLRETLGVEPSPRTAALFETITRG